MKILLNYLFFGVCFLCVALTKAPVLARQYQIEYEHTVNFETNRTDATYILYINSSNSLYVRTLNNFTEKMGNDVMSVNDGEIPFVEKDYSKKVAHYNQPIINKIFLVKDLLPLQDWELMPQKKVISGFNCRKAQAHFRGRTYTAWYTEDISLIGGPWKFDGLPGLILEVSSDDGVLNIRAINLVKTDNSLLIKSFDKYKVSDEKSISWKEYCEKYRKVIGRIEKSMRADNDPDVEYTLDINLVEDIGL